MRLVHPQLTRTTELPLYFGPAIRAVPRENSVRAPGCRLRPDTRAATFERSLLASPIRLLAVLQQRHPAANANVHQVRAPDVSLIQFPH